MAQRLMSLFVVFALLLTTAAPLAAQTDTPDPFCGNLKSDDCDLLRTSVAAMLSLESYHTAITYTAMLHGIPEMPVDHAEMQLHVAGDYAFDDAARASIRTLALISREEPLAAIEAIGNDPALLLNLYRGTTADLTVALDLSEEWGAILDEAADLNWPLTTTVAVRLVDGVLYFNIHELKPFVRELADSADWVAIEMVKTLETLADSGAFRDLADGVASSTTGRSVTGLDPMMVNLITSMRAAFGHPRLLEEFMTIRRRDDVDLANGDLRGNRTGAYFVTEFDVLDFIFSDEFRTLLQQSFEVAAANDNAYLTPEEAKQAADIFWFVAPALFRDLTIEGSTTVDLESVHEVASTSRVHWDLTTLIQILEQFGDVELSNRSDETYIALLVETANSAFDQPITVTAPAAADVVPFDSLMRDFSRVGVVEPSQSESPMIKAQPDVTVDLNAEALARYEEGVRLYEAGDVAAATEQLNQAIVRNPELADAYYYRGLAT
ncbi:MAG: hypothetical protein KDE58_27180, partial [Caldilineaceae bacterium]|nr:hypothetical protein [Caldilineaceae bacterium]